MNNINNDTTTGEWENTDPIALLKEMERLLGPSDQLLNVPPIDEALFTALDLDPVTIALFKKDAAGKPRPDDTNNDRNFPPVAQTSQLMNAYPLSYLVIDSLTSRRAGFGSSQQAVGPSMYAYQTYQNNLLFRASSSSTGNNHQLNTRVLDYHPTRNAPQLPQLAPVSPALNAPQPQLSGVSPSPVASDDVPSARDEPLSKPIGPNSLNDTNVQVPISRVITVIPQYSIPGLESAAGNIKALGITSVSLQGSVEPHSRHTEIAFPEQSAKSSTAHPVIAPEFCWFEIKSIYSIEVQEWNWIPKGGLRRDTPIGEVLRVMACQNLTLPQRHEFPLVSSRKTLGCAVFRSKFSFSSDKSLLLTIYGDQMRAFVSTCYQLKLKLVDQVKQFASRGFADPVTFELPSELVLGQPYSKYPFISIVPHARALQFEPAGKLVWRAITERAEQEKALIGQWLETDAGITFLSIRTQAFESACHYKDYRYPMSETDPTSTTFAAILANWQIAPPQGATWKPPSVPPLFLNFSRDVCSGGPTCRGHEAFVPPSNFPDPAYIASWARVFEVENQKMSRLVVEPLPEMERSYSASKKRRLNPSDSV